MEEKKNNKKFILVLIGIVGVCLIALGITYAYWILTKQQTGENVVNTACLNITFTGENNITLDKAYPLQPAELENFLSTATPYHFIIHNECSDLASATINLESLNVEGKALEDDYIDLILYEDDYSVNLNRYKKLTGNTLNDDNKVITGSKHAYSLYNFNLKPEETREFNLLLYMDSETPMEDANMNASWEGKITLSTKYQEDSKALRKISSNDSKGMWEYKDKITSLIIEDIKSEKQASDGGHVYGPFDESEYGTKSVESYVVCDENDENCTGYLQSDGKVIANLDSGYLFANFPKLNNIDNLEKLDTSNVMNMGSMFYGDAVLTELDLSKLDTINLINIASIFYGMSNLQKLDLSNWVLKNSMNSFAGNSGLNTTKIDTLTLDNIDTSKMTTMASMFYNLSYIKELNLNNIDTSNVTDMTGMFSATSSLKKISLEGIDMSKVTRIGSIFASNIEEISLANSILPSNSNALFNNLSSLVKLNLTNIDTSHVTNMSYMFQGCSGLTELDLSDFNTSQVTNMEYMFSGLNLSKLDLSSFDTTNLSNVANMFYNSKNLKEIDLSNWKFNNSIAPSFAYKTNIDNLSSDCNLILKNVDTSEVTNMSNMFEYINLTSLDLSYFDTSNVTNMDQMFYYAENLEHITFGSNFIYKSGTIIGHMFTGCPAIERPTDDSWSSVSFD